MGDSTALKASEDLSDAIEPASAKVARRSVDAALIRSLVDDHYRFIWRLLGRMGVREADLDDATQQVFMVLTQRSELEILVGSERSFLFGIALRVAHTHRRSQGRRRESDELGPELEDSGSSPEELVERYRARRLLDQILDDMPMDLRVPFVLFELEDVGSAEIAALLDIPLGTVASRLRRAREWFQRQVQQLQDQRLRSAGGHD